MDLMEILKALFGDEALTFDQFAKTLVKRRLKQITVYNDHCTVELKSGLKIDIKW